MERLTYRLNDQCDNPTDSIILKLYLRYEDPETRKKILNRLSSYEDTGLEPEEIKEFAEDVAYQFGYYFPIKDMLYISTGGLSTLERAFDILGWNDPHPVPECECEFPGCHKHATCGTPTKDGYKRVCGKHFAELTREALDMAISALWQQDHFREVTKKVEPLTLEELREMPCEPVYIVAGYVSWWDIVSFAGMEYLYLKVEGSLPVRDYGKNWTAYRQKPEEGTK